jgi:hypothetical protein
MVSQSPSKVHISIESLFVSLYATTCSLAELDEKINYMKISKSLNFKTKVFKGNHSFTKSFI